MIFIIMFSLAAALMNAVSSVIQRRAAGEPDIKELFRKDFSKRLSTDRLWILGFVLQTLAFFAQAAALKNGSLVLVEPLLIVDLIFLMLILGLRFHLPIGRMEWLATLMMCIGLSVLLGVANPKAGTQPFNNARWLATAIPILVVIGLGIYIVRRTRKSSRRAGFAGFAAGLSFALVAMMTKLTMQQLHLGIAAVFTDWQVYGLLFAGILSVIMAQNTYGAGPVAFSQPVMEATDPLISVFMGIVLFGDKINLSTPALIVETCAGALAIVGILLLGRSEHFQIQSI